MGMEATVNILHGHVLTNTKKERNLQHLTVKLSYRDKSHCLALHCIAGIHKMATFNIVIVTGAKVKINESNI